MTNNYMLDVQVTVIEKYDTDYCIIYKTSNNIIVYDKVNPTKFYNTNIGDSQKLDIVSKEQMGLESNSGKILFYGFLMVIIFLSGICMTTFTFCDLYYKIKNG